MVCYIVAKPYLKDQSMDIYDFMPMQSDPTPEERQKIQQENLDREIAEAKKIKDEVLRVFKEYGRV